jgi:hypothetical protein
MESDTPPRNGERNDPAATEEVKSSTTQRGAMANSPLTSLSGQCPHPETDVSSISQTPIGEKVNGAVTHAPHDAASLLASAKELLDTGSTAPPTAEQQRKALELLGLMDTMRKGQEKERVEETSALKKQGPPAPPVAVPVKRDRGGTALAPASTARPGQTLPGEGASAHGTTDATPGPHDEREGLTPSPDGQTASDPPATASRGSRASS